MHVSNISANSNLLGNKTGEIIATSGQALNTLWHFPILNADNNTVTFGNIVFALLALLIGLWYFNKLKVKLKAYLNKKFDDDKDAANAIGNFITYLLLIIFVTITLQIANVPLKTFAFVGGALAIGVGLGAQNLINNFMSSLIIMIERPIKIGDTVQIDDVLGNVVNIGARCVTIRTSSMTDVLVPNSRLIQENLINWSLLDSYSRTYVNIRFYKNQFCKIGKEMGSAPSGEEYKKAFKDISFEEYQPEKVLKKLFDIFNGFEPLRTVNKPEIYFIGTDNWYYNYNVVLCYDTKKMVDFNRLKSDINNEISKHFDIENLVIEYK